MKCIAIIASVAAAMQRAKRTTPAHCFAAEADVEAAQKAVADVLQDQCDAGCQAAVAAEADAAKKFSDCCQYVHHGKFFNIQEKLKSASSEDVCAKDRNEVQKAAKKEAFACKDCEAEKAEAEKAAADAAAALEECKAKPAPASAPAGAGSAGSASGPKLRQPTNSAPISAITEMAKQELGSIKSRIQKQRVANAGVVIRRRHMSRAAVKPKLQISSGSAAAAASSAAAKKRDPFKAVAIVV